MNRIQLSFTGANNLTQNHFIKTMVLWSNIYYFKIYLKEISKKNTQFPFGAIKNTTSKVPSSAAHLVKRGRYFKHRYSIKEEEKWNPNLPSQKLWQNLNHWFNFWLEIFFLVEGFVTPFLVWILILPFVGEFSENFLVFFFKRGLVYSQQLLVNE